MPERLVVKPCTEEQKHTFGEWEDLEDKLKRMVHRFCSYGRGVVQNNIDLTPEQYEGWLKIQRASFTDLFDEEYRNLAAELMVETKRIAKGMVK
jgi:hypothetical protein